MDKETVQPADENDQDKSTWAHDQQKRDYYYDDSYGYEIYNPDEEEEKPETNNLIQATRKTL